MLPANSNLGKNCFGFFETQRNSVHSVSSNQKNMASREKERCCSKQSTDSQKRCILEYRESDNSLTLSFIMLKNGQMFFINLLCSHRKNFKVCLSIFKHYEWKCQMKIILGVVARLQTMEKTDQRRTLFL